MSQSPPHAGFLIFKHRPSRLGFTLIELLIVLTVIVILASIGIPAFQDLIRDNRVSAHARDVGVILTFARSEALRRNGDVQVVIGVSRADVCPGVCNGTNALRSVVFDRVVAEPLTLTFSNRGYLSPFIIDGAAPAFWLEHVGCARAAESRLFRLDPTGQMSVDQSGGCA